MTRPAQSLELDTPFRAFAADIRPQGSLRDAITTACRRPEPECLPPLLAAAELSPADRQAARSLARNLVMALRAGGGGSAVELLVQEYALSSHEGVALMCLAEALLRIPDRPTRDALIRDKIATGDWHSHLGHSDSLFVNAATWGLVITGRLTATSSERGLSAALTRLIGRGGEPLIRAGVDIAMRMLGEQFVAGQTIGEALEAAQKLEEEGFRHSYDMLGEAAVTDEDARRYLAAYEAAIHAIGAASAGRGVYDGPGISVKLSALHPRYARAQRNRVMAELLPRLASVARLARRYDIGLNIDAEEADRLEISLDLLEALCHDPELAGWNGIGFVAQAYQKRCPFVLDFLIDLARRSGRRLMVRLVKGAYWDSEIKRAQVDGLAGFPVFTRKVHTDVCYLACARKLLDAPAEIFPQFATHNAQTLAAVMQIAGEGFHQGQYEFQCLHGMGESLYAEVVGADKLDRPCRIYAPVGTHETLLAYLVRRLLENGANSSFVHRIADEEVTIDALIADPVESARSIEPLGAPHPQIALPRDIFGAERRNSAGLDLADEHRLAELAPALLGGAASPLAASPLIAGGWAGGAPRQIFNPADHRDVVGTIVEASMEDVGAAFAAAEAAAPIWARITPQNRAAVLNRAADLMEAEMPTLLGTIVREAGKTLPNAIGEVREAVDFLRYYASEAGRTLDATNHRPLGVVVSISPWNFPLSIFIGQLSAALAAGNPVLAKPAEETPLVAHQAITILHRAGIPPDVLQLVTGDGQIGAALVADARCHGVVFTGSTEVARLIQRTLSSRLNPDGRPVPLIAETGGQNALIADSSALPEQVVLDTLTSAFDSAGQRCSAVRILCLQEDIADRVLIMLRGALAELTVGNPDRLSTDVGPVISKDAAERVNAHIEAMRSKGRAIHQPRMGGDNERGTFVVPTLIEIDDIGELTGEVFGPVLHVVRYRRDDLDRLIDAINATGYGLTFGLHSRIDETIDHVRARIRAGNIYVNRTTIGAVVGAQPFGGGGLSGTGPKAGGPLYLRRLLAKRPQFPKGEGSAPLAGYIEFLRRHGRTRAADCVSGYARTAASGESKLLHGPVGERNEYGVRPKGRIAVLAETELGLLTGLGAVLAAAGQAVIPAIGPSLDLLRSLPTELASRITLVPDWRASPVPAAILHEGDPETLLRILKWAATMDGPIVQVQGISTDALAKGSDAFAAELLIEEVSISTNTAAAGGNPGLMTMD